MSTEPQVERAPTPVEAAPQGALLRQVAGIRLRLAALTRRERSLLAARAGLQLVGATALVFLLAAALVSTGASRDLSLLVLGVVSPVLLLAALLWPLALRWSSSGRPLGQALRVEGLRPELRARLVTALERGEEAGQSPPAGVRALPISLPLLLRASTRAREVLDAVAPTEVHPARPLRPVAAVALGLLLAVGLATVWMPVGPFQALAAIASGEVAATRLAEGVLVADDRALVGDITLTYIYPDSMGLDPVQVPNSNGTIHAPPGTRVEITARTAEAFDAVAIQVDEQPPQDARLSDGRDISGSLLIAGKGTWRFVLLRGDKAVRSADFEIIVEADAPPVVQALLPMRQVAVDSGLGIEWAVDDDFGIARVVLEIEENGQVREIELRNPLDPPRTLAGQVRLSPRELGLSPGTKVTLRVVAIDTDLTTGGNRGVSPAMELQVLGPREFGARLERYFTELRDALVLVLADFLVEESSLPIANDSAAMVRWVEAARPRFDPVQEIMKRQWGDEAPSTAEGEAVRLVISEAAVLFRFTLTAFEAGSGRRVTMADLETFNRLHAQEIENLEEAVLVLDRVLQGVAMTEVVKAAAQLGRESQALSELAKTADAAEILARLDQLERMMARLGLAQERLAEGQLREFLNARLDAGVALVDEIRKALSEGRMEDARAMLEELARQIQQMSEGLEDQFNQAEEQQNELADQMKETIEQLRKLEQEQRAAADKLEQAKKEQGGEFQKQVEAWTRLDELADQALAQARGAVEAAGDGRGWRSDSIRRLEQTRESVAGLRDSIRAREVMNSMERTLRAQQRASNASAAVASERGRQRPSGEALPAGVALASEGTRELARSLDEIRELLDELSQQEQSTSPEMARLAREMAREQSELRERQQGMQKEVQGIEQKSPSSRGKATESMQRAGESMEQAQQSLEQARPDPGQGQMEQAAESIGEAANELERQQQQMQQEQQSGQRAGGKEPDEQTGNNESAPQPQSRLEIPPPEAFKTPEEYRRALLEGMEAPVPDEYKALNKRYYEELVRQ